MNLTDLHRKFQERYEHLRFAEYRDTNLELEIPKRIVNIDAHHELLKDVTGRTVQVGDIIAHGSTRYADVRVSVVIGYTPKTVKVSQFNEYSNLTGLACIGSFATSSMFLIVNPNKKSYKEVE
ncbi:MAG: hypothetical protein [Caudoviricetes sp.]|nr:MAG: hypothetical protein [Caudoviricetes sp.]